MVHALKYFFYYFMMASLLNSCTSYEKFKYITEDFEMPSKVFNVEFNQAWEAIVQVMKKFDLKHQSQEAGVIKTKWIDNTSELNFSDSFASSDSVKGAKYKITLNVVKGYFGTSEVSKVTIYKRQLVERDFLQGWKEIPSDGILEKTLLYRIRRVIEIDRKLRKIEKILEDKELQSF